LIEDWHFSLLFYLLNGEGFINVIPNNTYYIGWQNTGIGQCIANLQ